MVGFWWIVVGAHGLAREADMRTVSASLRMDCEVQEELASVAEALPDDGVIRTDEFEDGVHQKREDVEGRQRVGQILFAVPEVVVKVVAFGFEDIVLPLLALHGPLAGEPRR